MATDDNTKMPPNNALSRRDMLKSAGAVAAGLAATGVTSAQPAEQPQANPGEPKNPYGAPPGLLILAPIPVAPPIPARSIIGVKGDGPKKEGGDLPERPHRRGSLDRGETEPCNQTKPQRTNNH